MMVILSTAKNPNDPVPPPMVAIGAEQYNRPDMLPRIPTPAPDPNAKAHE